MSDDYNVVPDAQRGAIRHLEQEAEHLKDLLVRHARLNQVHSGNHAYAAQQDIADYQSDSTQLVGRVEELLIAELGAAANVKVVLVDERSESSGLQRYNSVSTISMSAYPG